MCGIVGMIARKPQGFLYKDEAIFKQLLFADTLRGVDSTGVFAVNKYYNLKAHKTATPAPSAIGTTTFQEFFKDIYKTGRAVFGHNRAATRGATVDNNAHPFIEGNICLIHNGTLTSHKHLADKEVDSHAICHSLSEKGYKDTFQNLHGAYALVWYDATEKKIHITRNHERPLHLAVSDDGFYIASELAMLDWILTRNEVKDYKLFFFQENVRYTWDLEDPSEFTTEKIPVKKSYPVVTTYYPAKATGHRQKSSGTKLPKVSYDIKQNILQLAHVNDDSTLPVYKIGDEIEFLSTGASESKRKNLVLMGYTEDGYDTPVSCKLPERVKSEVLDELYKADYIRATISAVYNKGGLETLYLRDPIVLYEYFETSNGKEVTKEMLEENGGQCFNCGIQLEFSAEDINHAVADERDGKLISITCKHCVADFSKWGVYTQHEGAIV